MPLMYPQRFLLIHLRTRFMRRPLASMDGLNYFEYVLSMGVTETAPQASKRAAERCRPATVSPHNGEPVSATILLSHRAEITWYLAMDEDIERRDYLRTLGGGLLSVGLFGTTGTETAAARERDPSMSTSRVDATVGAQTAQDGPPKEGVREAWRFEGEVESSPVVVDDTIFVGSRDDNIYALDATDGSEQWRFETEGAVESSPTVADGTVFVVSGDKNVYALDATDGSEQWLFETEGEVDSSPVVADDTVYVWSDRIVYALDAADSTEQWRFEAGSVSSPVIVGDTVFVRPDHGSLFVVDATNGTELWRFESDTLGYGSMNLGPAIMDGTVFLEGEENLYALNVADGTEQWRFEVFGGVNSEIVVHDDTVFFGDSYSNVYALDAAEGTEKWRFETEEDIYSSPKVVNETVFVKTWNGFYALDIADGTEEWRIESIHIDFPPTVVEDTVYVGGSSDVYAVDANDGTELWHIRVDRWSDISQPIVVNDKIVVASDGGVYAVTEGEQRLTAVQSVFEPDDIPFPLWWVVAGFGGVATVTATTVRGVSRFGIGRRLANAVGTSASGGQRRRLGESGLVASWLTLSAVTLLMFGLCPWVIESPLPVTAASSLPTLAVAVTVVSSLLVAVLGVRVLTDVYEYDAGTVPPFVLWPTALVGVGALGLRAVSGILSSTIGFGIVFVTANLVGLAAVAMHWRLRRRRQPNLPSIGVFTLAVVGIAYLPYHVWFVTSSGMVHSLEALGAAVLGHAVVLCICGVVIGRRFVGLSIPVRYRRSQSSAFEEDEEPASDRDADTADETSGDSDDSVESEEDVPSETPAEPEQPDDPDTDDADEGEKDVPDTPAAQFSHACDAVSGATTVDADGSVHVYDGALIDGGGQCRIRSVAPEQVTDDAAKTAFVQAVNRWGSISHNPYIATVYDSGDEPRPWVASDAGDRLLTDAIEELDRDDRLRVLDSVFEGLKMASRYNIANTAVAPDTVVLSGDGEDLTAELTDWGLEREVSAALDDPPVTPYTAPEQLDGGTAPTTSVYRVGMLAYWVLTGREPFAGAADLTSAIRAGDLRPPSDETDLPISLDECIAMATATDPADRFDDVADLREAIRAALD